MSVKAMERLDFELPEWTRVIWASAAARAEYEPRIGRATAAWTQIERLSVVEGVRPSALQILHPEGLPALSQWAAEHGLVVLVLGRESASDSYRASGGPPEPGQPWKYRVAITRPEHAAEWHREWAANDDEAIGRLLGFPACCRAFFVRTWVNEQYRDTTWPMFVQSGGSAEGPPEANILLRWLGVRLVSHLPCSFTCDETVRLGRAMAEVGRARGYVAEVADIEEMLAWPVEWSALHGIAEIRTPVIKVSTRTDATAVEYRVSRPGSRYPELGARGLRAPYRASPLVQITATRSFARSLEPAREWTDNGFGSYEAMRAAHDVVLQAAPETGIGSVLDLGCGNGALLDRFGRRYPGAKLIGVEKDADRARRKVGRARIEVGDLLEWDGDDVDLALLMPGRLLEVGEEKRVRLLRWLHAHAGAILAYAYGDWLERCGSFSELLAAAGLAPVAEPVSGATAAAVLARVAPPAPVAAGGALGGGEIRDAAV
jgi:SAM-dependent methyltransferase